MAIFFNMVYETEGLFIPKAESKKEGPKKFGVPDKKAVLL